MLLGPAVDGEHKNDGKFIFAKSISSYPLKPKCVSSSPFASFFQIPFQIFEDFKFA